MKIHKDLLTHDNVAPATTGKVIDLGFNGDFDHKKSDWNMLFVQFAGKATGTDMTVSAFSVQSGISGIITAGSIGQLVIPRDDVRKGGVFGIPVPRGLKRYFTIVFSGSTMPDYVTAGITDEVDTDTRFDWMNYKAANTGSSEVVQKSEYVGEVIDGTVHEAITSSGT
jgi:hypothetical protein